MKVFNKIFKAFLILMFMVICYQFSYTYASTDYIVNENLTYKQLESETLIAGFEVGKSVSNIINDGYFSTEYSIKIFDNENNDITEQLDKTIGTNYIIKLYKNDNLEKEYTIVLYGDTTGDGTINAVDALAVIKNKLGNTTFKTKSVEEAGRIIENTRKTGDIPTSADALAIIKYKLNPKENPIEQKLIVEDKKEEIVFDSSTPVGKHGELKVSGTKIIDENGETFQLKGVSTHGLAWYPQYVNRDAFEYMRDEWKINVVRLAMYSDPNAGYSREQWTTVKNGVDYATNAGLYVIIDWHILNDNNPNTYKSEAIEFFKDMATTYKDNVNVIYEICNEPNGNVTWENDIKPYAEEVISEIRKIDNDAIIICGTPTWSQDVDIVSENPITNYDNIMYALHFYAATHTEDLRNKLLTALNNNLPVFVSEFGICDASGNGEINETEANTWIDLLNQKDISWICWNLSNKDESSSLLLATTDKLTDWSKDDLSQSGKWLVNKLNESNIVVNFEDEKFIINIEDSNGIISANCSIDMNGDITNDNFIDKADVTKNNDGDIIKLEYNILNFSDLVFIEENEYLKTAEVKFVITVENKLHIITEKEFEFGFGEGHISELY